MKFRSGGSQRKGNIAVVVGLITCMCVFAYASIFMTSSGARLERRASLEQVANQIATAAIEETLVKLQNGVAPWKKMDKAGDKAVKTYWPAAATSMMYADSGVKVQPVRVMARPINEQVNNEMKNRFYSRFAGLPNYHPQHAEGWESKLTGAAANLVKPPAGVTINKQLAQQTAAQFKSLNDDMRKLAMELPVLDAGRDHTDSELTAFKKIVNGSTGLRELAAEATQPRAQAANPLAPITNLNQPDPNARSLDGSANAAGQQTGDNGCAAPTAAASAIQAPLAVVGASGDEKVVNPNNPTVADANREATQGKVFSNAPFLVTLETKVEVPDALMSTVSKPAYAQRIVGEYQFEEAAKNVAGRTLGYWIAYNNLTVNDAYRMGWVSSTTKPEADFAQMFPQTGQLVPARSYQVWPFTIADSNVAAKAK